LYDNSFISFIHFILFTRSTFGGATLRYRTRPYKFKYPKGHHDKIQHVHYKNEQAFIFLTFQVIEMHFVHDLRHLNKTSMFRKSVPFLPNDREDLNRFPLCWFPWFFHTLAENPFPKSSFI
jgi:hypothetical protein